MKTEEYLSKKDKLKSEYNKSVNDLNLQYALSNANYKVGDIITDHSGSILIEKIVASTISTTLPDTVYYGVELKKDKTPTKKADRRYVYQLNVK